MCVGYWVIPHDDEVKPLIEEWILEDLDLFTNKQCGYLFNKYCQVVKK